jgi:hypothetical protein
MFAGLLDFQQQSNILPTIGYIRVTNYINCFKKQHDISSVTQNVSLAYSLKDRKNRDVAAICPAVACMCVYICV